MKFNNWKKYINYCIAKENVTESGRLNYVFSSLVQNIFQGFILCEIEKNANVFFLNVTGR